MIGCQKRNWGAGHAGGQRDSGEVCDRSDCFGWMTHLRQSGMGGEECLFQE